MMKNIFLVLSIAVMCFRLAGCNKLVIKDELKGMWSIDSINVSGNNIKHCLLSNIIIFYDGECEIPSCHNDCIPDLFNCAPKGNWDINHSDTIPLILSIQSISKGVINGKFQVVFHEDKVKRMLVMELISKDTYIICRKGLYSYIEKLETIRQLVEMTK
ncbi:MAG: hypothetical protein MUE96_12695 [Bacteroidia bacterium]|jgi:hypothetical protein|nr:hypothetical protein [Bacteroidia bacterium]